MCFDRVMSEPLRVRRLPHVEGQQIQRIVSRGGGKSDKSHVRWPRAPVVLASAGGNTVPVITRLVVTSEDRVRGNDPPVQRDGDEVVGPSVGGWPSPPDHD